MRRQGGQAPILQGRAQPLAGPAAGLAGKQRLPGAGGGAGVRRVVAAHDVGRAVNPLSVEGQIEGGVVMSMGYALTERYPFFA